jgi:hypothetical protein
MISTNYSKDAELLDIEITDYDTKYGNETGINLSRMRLPERYDIAKYYVRNKRNSKVIRDDEVITRRKGEWGKWVHKDSEDLPDISDDFDWQITYNFPATRHNNKSPIGATYGGENVTYRRLYLILCEHFNGGEYFVDTYFDTVYPYTVKPDIDMELNKIKSDLVAYAEDYVLDGAVVTKSGNLDKRYNVNKEVKKRLKDYKQFASEWEESHGEELADKIKKDIIRALEIGEIPLSCSLSEGTLKARKLAGITSTETFFAMGDLIEHINLYVRIGGNKKWRTKQGLLV